MLDSRRKQLLDTIGVQRWVRRDQPSVEIEAQEADEMHSPKSGDLGWEELKLAVSGCRQCSLAESRTNTVFGTGSVDADLLIVGEAPGADEDRAGEPFVGRAGGLLTQMLAAIGLTREEVFIANILKCRPPGNRNPSPEEALACRPWLERQIATIKPKLILSVGGVSATNLLQTDTAVGQLRGKIHSLGDERIPLIVTYHPAYLLRKPSEKAKSWQDMKLVVSALKSGE